MALYKCVYYYYYYYLASKFQAWRPAYENARRPYSLNIIKCGWHAAMHSLGTSFRSLYCMDSLCSKCNNARPPMYHRSDALHGLSVSWTHLAIMVEFWTPLVVEIWRKSYQSEKPPLEVAPTTLRLALLILQFPIHGCFFSTLQDLFFSNFTRTLYSTLFTI